MIKTTTNNKCGEDGIVKLFTREGEQYGNCSKK
jgi:hypothetical protein